MYLILKSVQSSFVRVNLEIMLCLDLICLKVTMLDIFELIV